MKKILFYILLILSLALFSSISYSYAGSDNKGIKVMVSEKIPGAGCTTNKAKPGKPPLYECTIKKGFGSITDMMGEIIKYFTYLAGLFGVLFIIINGVMYSMGGMEQSLKDEAKKRIMGTILGLILLFLSGIILNIIAPWVYK